MPPRDASFASFDSPLGRFWLGGGNSGLLIVTRAETPEGLLSELARHGLAGAPDPGRLSEPMEWLRAYFAGERPPSLPRVDWRAASDFDAAVYLAALAIPYGTTASYGDVAAAVGSPRAARAVGGAMARCPLFPVVPCHRVIHADGSIGGWGPDLWVKRWLLRHEQRQGAGHSG